MPNGSITIYKLIILYTLSKVDSPLPPGVISDYITDRGYTNYFNLQNAFGELLEADLIKEDSTYHLTYYTLTEAGAETLELFGAPLSREIRDEINHYLEEHKFEIIDDTSLVSDYHATNDGLSRHLYTARRQSCSHAAVFGRCYGNRCYQSMRKLAVEK